MLLSIMIIILLVASAVVLHYEILRLLSIIIPKLKVKHRIRVVVGVFGTICAHIIEVWMFGIAFYLMFHYGDFGTLEGNYSGSLVDSVYFSFSNYTTIGYGDIEPFGQMS